MRRIAIRALLATFVFGCGTETVDVHDFDGYGVNQPGFGKVHGGQMFLEVIHKPDGDIGQLNAWARTFDPDPAPPASFPIPIIPPMTCMDISTSVFPRPPAEGSIFTDLGGDMSVTSNGVTITAIKKQAATGSAFVDNLQFGIPLGYQNQPFDPSGIQDGADYTINFPGSENLTPNTFHMAPYYAITTPSIGKAPVTLTRGQPLHIAWDPIGQEEGGTHTADRSFPFLILLGLPSMTTGQVKYFCPMNDGHVHNSFDVPVEVVDALPDAGIIVMGHQTHMMGLFNERRFDLITINCNRSPFSFTP